MGRAGIVLGLNPTAGAQQRSTSGGAAEAGLSGVAAYERVISVEAACTQDIERFVRARSGFSGRFLRCK
jgi:hypothetical protein